MTIDEAEKIKTVVENRDYIGQLVNTVAKTMIEAFENLKIEGVNMFQLGYNKAIDDFAEKLSIAFDEIDIKEYGFYPENLVRQVAKQLKASVKNETN